MDEVNDQVYTIYHNQELANSHLLWRGTYNDAMGQIDPITTECEPIPPECRLIPSVEYDVMLMEFMHSNPEVKDLSFRMMDEEGEWVEIQISRKTG